MSKLYFRFGPVMSGKSLDLLKISDNYTRQGKEVRLWKPKLDTRDGTLTVSRLGLSRETDLFIHPELERFQVPKTVSCILIDEAQFLSEANVYGIRKIPSDTGVPVICYGLRADFRGNLFAGSAALFACADKIEEVKTICWLPGCNKKAIHNARTDKDGNLLPKPSASSRAHHRDKSGEVILGHDFRPTCYKHWNG